MKHIIAILILAFTQNIEAQLLINEVSSSCNTIVIVDNNGKRQDWIEIYNPTASPVNASGFYISNSATAPLKWQLPNINIAAGGFLKIYCSGQNTVIGTFYHSNFKLERAGETVYIYNASSVLVDSKPFGNLEQNDSYGRSPDGSSTWAYFKVPTPGLSNTTTAYTAYCPDVVFSVNRGFYTSAQTLSLSCPGYQIRYTSDGSEPTVSSILYTGALSIPTTSLIKAKSFATSGNILPGKTIIKTYLINEQQLAYLPIVSISLDPAVFNALYSSKSSTYAGQFAHLEFFKNRTKFIFETDFELKLHGNSSLLLSQKGMRVNCRTEYNVPVIKDTLFPWDSKKLLKKFDGFNLRNDYPGSLGWGAGGMWDGYATEISRTQNIDYLAYQPCIVFINGNYWGEYQLREKGDNDYIESNYPSEKKDSIDMLQQTTLSSFSITTMCGSDTGFVTQYNYINTTSPTSTAFYNFFKAKFDLKNFFDYFISEIYVGNNDWITDYTALANNIKLWRSQKPGGKWRYILFDCDYSIGPINTNYDIIKKLLPPIVGAGNEHAKIFSRVMQNPTYKTYFINRFADLLNTRYLPAQAAPIVTAYKDTLLPVIQRHLQKWGSVTLPQWQNNFTNLINVLGSRVTNLRNHIQTDFTLPAQVTTTFEVYPTGKGTVLLNTIEPQIYPWAGVYFNGAPITVKSKPIPGYIFDHWESPDLGLFNTTDSNTVNLNSSQVIKLYFKVDPNVNIKELINDHNGDISLFPNPTNKELKFKLNNKTEKDVFISVYNLTGSKISDRITFNTSDDVTDISSLIKNCSEGVYFIEIKTGENIYYEKIIVTGN